MQAPNFKRVFFTLLIATTLPQVLHGAVYDGQLARMPASVNAIILIDAGKTFDSDYGRQQNWKQNYAQRFDSSPSMLPPTTDLFAWGTELDLQYMSPSTQFAAMTLSRDLSFPQLARWTKGTLGNIEGLETVTTRRGGTAIKFSEVEYGVVMPSSRQKTARWIRATRDSSDVKLSSYLKEVASDAARTESHICQAIDLTDCIDRQSARAAIANSTVVKQQSLDVDKVADLLIGIRGVKLMVTFTDTATCKLVIDFTDSPSVLGDHAKELIIEILSEAGASLSELPDWAAKIGPKTVELEGPLGESGLMRIFAFLEFDSPSMDDGGSKAVEKEKPKTDKPSEEDRYANDPAKITREYYKSVQKYMRDLSHERGAKSYYSIAVWYDKYAKRIERLPILNVDPEMLDYSELVIGHLRAAADSIQAGGVKTAARGKQITAGASGYDGYRYSNNGYRVFSGGANYAASQVASVEADRRAIRAEEKAQSTLDAKGHLAAIENETIQIRRQMTEKYGIEF